MNKLSCSRPLAREVPHFTMSKLPENKQVDIEAALKRFDAEVAEIEEEVDLGLDNSTIEREREEKDKYVAHIASILAEQPELNSNQQKIGHGCNDKDYLQRPQIEKLLEIGGYFNPYGVSSYSRSDIDAILLKTLAWEGPEMEKPITSIGACGFIGRLNDEGEPEKCDVFECTKRGTDKEGKTGSFVIGQILQAPRLTINNLRITEFLDGADGGVGRYKLSHSVLLNSKDEPGTEYNGVTPPTLVKRYNIHSFRAAKLAFDEDKKMGGVKSKAGGSGDAKKQKDTALGISSEQAFEFKIAFDIVAEEFEPGFSSDPNGAGIPQDRISDVFLALGYTLMDYDMDFIIENSFPTADNLFLCTDLLEAFDLWKQKQLSYDNLKTVFNALVSLQKLPTSFEQANAYSSKIPGDTYLPSEALKNALNSALRLDGDSRLRLHEIEGVEREISSNAQNHITLADFIQVFRS